jgi:hypothetical protein
MARFNAIQIGSVYLTEDGTSGSTGVKSEVPGLEGLYSGYTGATVDSIGGPSWNFSRENLGKGVRIEIRPESIPKTVLDLVKAALDAVTPTNGTVRCVFTGDTGTYDVDCKPVLPIAAGFGGRFINGRIKDAHINLVVDSIN